MAAPARIQLPACTVDLERFEVTRSGETERLTANESAILAYLVARRGRSVSRDELLTEVLGYKPGLATRALDSAIRRLRHKIEVDPAEPLHLVSVYGVGYRFEAEAEPVVAEPVRARGQFFGREAEIATLRGLLASPGLVTVVGPGGVGKTRTAREAAGDALFVEVADARDAGDLAHRVALGLGFSAGGGDVDRRVGRALAGRSGVVLLDNLEQITDASGVLATWLEMAPQLRLLVTSRRRLGLPSERVVELPPLDRASAIALMLARAGYVPQGDETEPLAEIARQLDDLPLALELAGSRLGIWSPTELSAQIARTLGVLRPREPREPRHTLRGTVSWSLDLLGADARAACLQAATFAGGFDLPAWVAVARTEGDVVEVLEQLLEHSLVRSERTAAGTRLTMLQTIREVALEMSADDPAVGEALDRHARHYLAEAEAHRDDAVLRGQLDRHERERDNLMAAFARASSTDSPLVGPLALALDVLLLPRGPLATRREVLARALAAGSLSAPQRADLAWRHADTERLLGRATEAREGLEEALRLARGCGDRAIEGVVVGTAGAFSLADGDYARAEALLREAIAIHREVGNHRSEGTARFNLANLQQNRREREEAEAGFREALRCLGRAGDTVLAPAVLSGLAMLHLDLGHIDDARALLEKAVGTEGRMQGAHRLYVRQNLGHVQLAAGRLDEAAANFAALIEEARRIGDQFVLPDALHGLALARVLGGDAAAAEPLLEEARQLHAQLGRPLFEALVASHVSVVLRERGQRYEARAMALDAARKVEEVGAAWLAEALAHAAAAEADVGEVAAARELLARSRGLGGAPALCAVVERLIAIRAGEPAEGAREEARLARLSDNVDVQLASLALAKATGRAAP